MSKMGLSKTRLASMQEVMKAHVQRGDVPGFAMALSHKGESHAGGVGVKTIGNPAPVQRNTLFRISSMTKPIAAVAALILLEECKLRLDDPIERWIPELADRKVLKRIDGPIDDTVPVNRAITVRDVLTLRLGIGLLFGSPDQFPILRAIQELGIIGFGPPNPTATHPPDEWLRKFATLPLMCQPGERWLYNTGYCLLGILIARASGKDLETFFRERIFDPLGMADTSFTVPSAKVDRLSTCYRYIESSKAMEIVDMAAPSHWASPPPFPDAAAGLVSTVDDFLAFSQMLLDFGKAGKDRILSRTSVEAMTTDQLTREQKAISGLLPGQWDNAGYGFGVSVANKRDSPTTGAGQFGWDGGYGSSWRIDPKEQLIGIILTSRIFESPRLPDICADFWTCAYRAIDD